MKQEEEDTNSFAAIPETNGHVEIKKEEPSSPVKLKEEKLSSPVKVKNERLSPVKVERQSVSPVKKAAVKSEEESDDEDDVPLVSFWFYIFNFEKYFLLFGTHIYAIQKCCFPLQTEV